MLVIHTFLYRKGGEYGFKNIDEVCHDFLAHNLNYINSVDCSRKVLYSMGVKVVERDKNTFMVVSDISIEELKAKYFN